MFLYSFYYYTDSSSTTVCKTEWQKHKMKERCERTIDVLHIKVHHVPQEYMQSFVVTVVCLQQNM